MEGNEATVNRVLEKVSRLKPNMMNDNDAADWIMDLNERLIMELHMDPELPRPKAWPEDGDVPLAASGPYDDLYIFYVMAMMEYYQREYANYNNSILLFNDRVADFRRHYRRENRPENTKPYEGVF